MSTTLLQRRFKVGTVTMRTLSVCVCVCVCVSLCLSLSLSPSLPPSLSLSLSHSSYIYIDIHIYIHIYISVSFSLSLSISLYLSLSLSIYFYLYFSVARSLALFGTHVSLDRQRWYIFKHISYQKTAELKYIYNTIKRCWLRQSKDIFFFIPQIIYGFKVFTDSHRHFSKNKALSNCGDEI